MLRDVDDDGDGGGGGDAGEVFLRVLVGQAKVCKVRFLGRAEGNCVASVQVPVRERSRTAKLHRTSPQNQHVAPLAPNSLATVIRAGTRLLFGEINRVFLQTSKRTTI